MALIHDLIEQRARAWESVKDGFERAARDGAFESPEAEARYAREDENLKALDARIAQLSEVEARNASAEEMRAKYASAAPKAPEVDADPIRRMANGEIRAYDFVGESRDLSKLSAGAGLNTVPTSFMNELWAHLIQTSPIRRSNVRQIRTRTGEALQVPKTTSHSTAAIVAEAGAIGESDPVFGQVTLDAFKYALAIQVSHELENDTGVDLSGYLAMQAGRALANASNTHFITGTGSGQPNGIVTASTLGITGGAGVAGAFTADNLVDLYYSVIEPYRVQGSWLMGDNSLKAARKLKDADNQYLWAPGLVAGEPSTLLGRPVLNDFNIPSPALAAKSVVFGDMSAYLIRDVESIRVERSVDFAFANDLVTWRFIMRTDGDLIDLTGAVKHFIGNAA